MEDKDIRMDNKMPLLKPNQSDLSETVDCKLINYVLELLASAVIVIGDDKNILMANKRAEQMFGVVQGELSGTPAGSIFMPDDRDIFLSNILKLTRKNGEFETEAMLLKRDGSSFMALISSSYMKIGGDAFVVVITQDISGLKGIEKALNQSERMAFLGRMLDDISHQIRNPIFSIGGFARRLSNTGGNRQDYVRVILDECKRLELLVTTLTEFIQMPRLSAKPTHIHQILEAVKEQALLVAENFGVDLSCVVSNQIDLNSTALADISALKKAVEACVTNACEAYTENGNEKKVEIKLMPSDLLDYHLLITIKDYGMGIRSSLLEKVFDPFFSAKSGHIGMGLTFAKRIMDEQYGRIVIASEYKEGTTLSLYLVHERRRSIRTKLM